MVNMVNDYLRIKIKYILTTYQHVLTDYSQITCNFSALSRRNTTFFLSAAFMTRILSSSCNLLITLSQRGNDSCMSSKNIPPKPFRS